MTLSRLGQSVELVLHKAVILDTHAPQVSLSQVKSVVTLMPGKPAVIGGSNGRTITLEAEILDVTK